MARDDKRQVPVSTRRGGLLGDQLIVPFSRLRTEIDRLFDDFPTRLPAFSFGRISSSIPVPAIEMSETENAYNLSAELPGLEPSDVEVTVENGMIVISGEKKEEREEKEEGFMMTERSHGSFERRVELPTGADAENIKANFRNGVLKITVAKDEKAKEQKRKIEIQKA